MVNIVAQMNKLLFREEINADLPIRCERLPRKITWRNNKECVSETCADLDLHAAPPIRI